MNTELAEFLGIMFGDGCLSRNAKARMIYICGHKEDDLVYHQTITLPLLKKLFNKDAIIGFRKKENALFIKFSDKEIFNFLKQYLPVGRKYESMRIPKEILLKKEYLFAFFRGLIDTDGCIVFSKQHKKEAYYLRIELSSKSKEFLLILLQELKKYNFYGSVSHKGKQNYRLELPGRKNLQRYIQNIDFHNPKIHKKIRKKASRMGFEPMIPRLTASRKETLWGQLDRVL
tara:strand:+ start:2121 stop:2810 length:690 start_codon:yes stop_codon:yes gene_type:complete